MGFISAQSCASSAPCHARHQHPVIPGHDRESRKSWIPDRVGDDEGLVVDDEGLVVDDEGLVGDDNFPSAPSCQPVGQQAHQLMEHQVPFARTSG